MEVERDEIFGQLKNVDIFHSTIEGIVSLRKIQSLLQINSCESYDDDELNVTSYFISMMLCFFISPYIFKYDFSSMFETNYVIQ